MLRAGLYVDGLNLYHGLDDLIKSRAVPQPHHLKWVSLRELGEQIIAIDQKLNGVSGKLEVVHYFSAWSKHLNRFRSPGEPTTFGKQQIYVRALNATKTTTHMANFTAQSKECRAPRGNGAICGHRWVRHEEKQSDVGLAVQMMEDALTGSIDTFYMLSGDTDLIPVLRSFRRLFSGSNKRLVCVAPPGRATPTEMQLLVDDQITLKERNIANCLLPASLIALDGSKIRRPKDYDPPP